MNSKIQHIVNTMKYKTLPAMVNRYTIKQEHKFLIDDQDIIKPARSYFDKDPKIWKLPAKNYFVRICLAFYIAELYNIDPFVLMDYNEILPYEDIYSKRYSEDKNTYDTIINNIDIINSYGYHKTIEIFGYLYHD